MKQLVLAALMATGAYAQPSQQADGRVMPFPYEVVELENGFRAYFIKAGGRSC